MFDQEILDNYAVWILDVKYKQVNTNKVAVNYKQLNINQCHNLKQVMVKYMKLFDGSLGVYPNKKVHLDLLTGSELVHQEA